MRYSGKIYVGLLRDVFFVIAATAVWTGTALADVKPLNLYQLDALEQQQGCIARSGDADGCEEENRRWDKDISGGVDETDVDLALREYWDDGELTYICYQKYENPTYKEVSDLGTCEEDCIVFPHSLCGSEAAECLKEYTPEECEDVDGDGLRKKDEDELGTSDYVYNADCSENAAVCGFDLKCDSVKEICLPRDCPESGCTAFHLETVSVNNNELIVHVHYDYSPVTATILDLYIDYSYEYLNLIYSRLLPVDGVILSREKELHVTQQLDGRLRLTILSRGDETPIPYGAVVELVFNRISTAQTSVGFSSQDHLQVEAMAPVQGVDEDGVSMTERLADDSLWGADVQVPAADPNGPRLLLYYSFDNSGDLLDYKNVKSGEEICELTRECGLLDDSDPAERAVRDKLEARLGNLQKGSEKVTEAIDAVIGPGVYLDGKTDHLKLPITVDDPVMDVDGRYYYHKRAQSFSVSTWFYAEADDSLDQTPYGQILFSRNTNEERTRFGLAVRRSETNPDSDKFDLVWFQGRVSDRDELVETSISQVVLKEDLPAREWTHIGMVVTDTLKGVDDDGDDQIDEADEFDRVSFFVDGNKLTWDFPDNDSTPNVPKLEAKDVMPFLNSGRQYELGDAYKMQCPFPVDSGGLYIHEEGVDVGALGGSGSPEVVMFASAENNLFGIEQMDLNGFDQTEIIRDGVSSAKDVDYSPLLDKIVYSSSQSGNYEIWIANGDGSNARQITKGFGDTSRKIFARRPKWAPDGSAIVFDSNIYSISYNDNWYARSYNIYYIEYDAKNNEVRIPLQDGGTLTELDYDVLATNQIVHDYRLSSTDTHSFGAVWGRKGTSSDRGAIWFNRTNRKFKQKEIVSLVIPERINASKEEVPAVLGGCEGDPGDRDYTKDDSGKTEEELREERIKEECSPTAPEYKILDAYNIQKIPVDERPPQSEMLYLKEWITYDDKGEVTSEPPATRTGESDAPSAYFGVVAWSGRDATVNVVYDPMAHHFGGDAGRCWDDDSDGFDDADENKYDPDSASDVWNWMDCTAFEIPGLYLQYNQQAVTAFPEKSVPAPWIVNATDDASPGLAKEMQIEESHTLCGDYVKVRVTSPINNLRLFNHEVAYDPADLTGKTVAQIRFQVPDCAEVDIDGNGSVDIPQMAGCQAIEKGDNYVVPQPTFTIQVRNTNQELRIADLSDDNVESGKFLIQDNALEFVTGAEFSPDGNRVILTGIQKARPVMLVSKKPPLDYDGLKPSKGLSFNTWKATAGKPWGEWSLNLNRDECAVGPIQFDKISSSPMNIEGMDWTRLQRYYPCNWVGAHKDRDTKMFSNAFRGGLDELRLYSYAREDKAFMSDYQRGHEWLEKEERDGKLGERENECESDTECPPYKVCTDNKRCEIKPCDPDTTGSCRNCKGDDCQPQGVCTLMPVPNQLGEDPESFELDTDPETTVEMRWVCSVECSTDRQCFREECLNGPCRFCSTDTKSCIECEDVKEKITNDIILEYIDGCPDRNSFACEAGSCITECYAFENGESIYLCDPAIEYCSQGRCKLFDWDWTDIAPMSFMGLGETAYDLPSLRITTAIPQMYPVVIKAYGVEDYLRPPEILVEGRNTRTGTNPHGSKWFKIGQVQVYNKNATEAEQNKYVVYTPAQVEEIRLRLILPSYDNRTASARGYNDWEGDHGCRDGACRTCESWKTEYDTPGNENMAKLKNRCPTAMHCEKDSWQSTGSCTWRATGSRSIIGYNVGITEQEQRRYCQEHGRSSNCRYQHNADIDKYLWGGHPAVAILEVKVAGKTGSITSNRFCPYYMEDRRAVAVEEKTIAGKVELTERVTPFSKITKLSTDPDSNDDIKAITAEPMSVVRYNEGLSTEFTSVKANYRVFGSPKQEHSPQREMLNKYENLETAQSQHSWAEANDGLVQANCTEHDICYKDGSGIGDDWALLNCNVYEIGVKNSEYKQAAAVYHICNSEGCDALYPTIDQVGSIQEDPSGCSIVRGMRREPCYEWIGNDVSMDFMSFMEGAKEPWFTLDFDYYRGFGYDNRALSEDKGK